MGAELIAVGSELLHFGLRDTNADWLTQRLQRLGVEVRSRRLVEDDIEAIASAVECALRPKQPGTVLITGGLGPTEDDRTREGLARAMHAPLERDPEQVGRLRELFRSRGMRFEPFKAKQADRPRGTAWIENPVGSAPGIERTDGDRWLFALPGVPAEMRAMFEHSIAPRLAKRAGSGLAYRRLKIFGRGEAWVDDRLRDLYDVKGVGATILARETGVELCLRATAESGDEAIRRVDEIDRAMSDRIGADLYGRDEETLAGIVGKLLEARGEQVATAESCTAGLLGAELTGPPGSSRWFRGGLVVYSDELKQDWSGVRAATLDAHGAVSEEVARELASGVRERSGAAYGLAVTGIAGPGGGTAEKPVGTVHVALAFLDGIEQRRLRLYGDRAMVRRRTVSAALDLLRRRLLERGPA